MSHHLLHILSTYGLFIGLPVLFLGIVLWVYRPSAVASYRTDGRIPFADDPDKPAKMTPPAAEPPTGGQHSGN